MSAPPAPAVTTDPTAPPDAVEVHCPLCEYDLRGLVEPRCPECGDAFEWVELTDPTRRRHRYLFEHHAERNVWSFFRTLLGHLRPRRFWCELHPSQPSRPCRLAFYAVLIVLSALPAGVMPAVAAAHAAWREMSNGRLVPMLAWRTSRVGPMGGAWMVPSTSPAAPAPTWLDAVQVPYVRAVLIGDLRIFGLAMLWPVLTLAALMIFAVSMRRARLRRVHLVRCVVYCADAFVWGNGFLGVLIGCVLAQYLLGGNWVDYRPIVAWTLAAAVAVFAYRLCVAFTKYLRFDHPVWTVLSTQVIVGLAVSILVILVYA